MSHHPPPPPPPGSPPPPGPPPGPAPWPGPQGRGGAGQDHGGHDPRELGAEPPDTSPFPLWAGLTVTGLFLLPVVVFGLIGIAMEGNGAGVTMSTAELVFALAFSIIIQMALFAIAIMPLLVKGWFGRPLWGSTRPLSLAIGLAVGVGATVFAYIVMTVIGLIFMPEDPVEQQIMQDALRGGAPMALAILIAVVLAPITEELIFRGVLFRSLRAKVGVWPAAIASSIVFTFIHVEVVTSQPLALTGLFLLGVVFAIALQKSGSLLVPILAHAVFNATSIAVAIIADRFDIVATAALPFGSG